MFRSLFVSLLAGLWLSVEEAHCQNLDNDVNTMTLCYNTSSRNACFTTFIAKDSHQFRQPFETARHLCNSTVPGSSLIRIDSLEGQRTAEIFLGRQELSNETIVIDAQKLAARYSVELSWVNGHPTVPKSISKETTLAGIDAACVESKHGHSLVYCASTQQSLYRYICEYTDSRPAFSYRNKKSRYFVSNESATWYDARNECLQSGGDLASITDLKMIRNWSSLKKNERYWIGLHRKKWIWNSTGAALTYTNWKGGYPDEASSENKCVCMDPQYCRVENNGTICDNDRKWKTCNCDQNYVIVCQKEDKSLRVVTGETLQSTSRPTTRRKRSTRSARATTTFTNTSIATSPITTTTSTETAIASTPITTFTSTETSIATTPITVTTSAETPIATSSITTTTSTETSIATSSITTSSSTETSIDTTTITVTTSTETPIATTPITATTSTETPIATSSITATTSTETPIATNPITTTTSTETETYTATNPITTTTSTETETSIATNPITTTTSTETSIATNPITTTTSTETETSIATNPITTTTSTETETSIATNPITTTTSTESSVATGLSTATTSTETSIATNPITTTYFTETSIATSPITTTTSTESSIATGLSTAATSNETPSTGLVQSFGKKEILLVVLLLLAVSVIIVAVILLIGKRKRDKRIQTSPEGNIKQGETGYFAYATVSPGNTPPEATTPAANLTCAELDVTQQTALSNDTIYATVQPTTEAIDMGENVAYADIDFSDPNGITVEEPIYLEAMDVKPEDGSGEDAVATQDLGPVYAESMKLKKST